MIALLFVLPLVLAIWLAVRLGGVRRREEPSGSTRRARRKADTNIVPLPGDGGFDGSGGTEDDSKWSSDSFEGGGGRFGGGGASGSWDDSGGDSSSGDSGGGD